MFDREIFSKTLTVYKDNVEKTWAGEKYKWIAVKCFQDNWNIDAPDFKEMFLKSTEETKNLLLSSKTYPRGMMSELIDTDSEKTRLMFRTLFDETKDLESRITEFIKSSDEILEVIKKRDNKDNIVHYQNTNTISTYLWLRYPDKYYIYKYSIFKELSKILKSSYTLKPDGKADTAVEGYKFYDEIRNEIKKDSELISIFKNHVDETCYPDSELVTLTIDFGYCTTNYIKNKSVSETQQQQNIWLYSPGENAKKWDEYYEKDVMGLGWNEVGNLSKYETKDKLNEELIKYFNDTNQFNTTKALWDFTHEMKIGDIILAREGKTKLIGKGIVDSDYFYDTSDPEYPNLRKVIWTNDEKWEIKGSPFAQKTLTQIKSGQESYKSCMEYLKIIGDNPESPITKSYTNWEKLDDGRVLKKVDKTIITHKVTVVPKWAYDFFGVYKPEEENGHNIRIVFNGNNYTEYINRTNPNSDNFEIRIYIFKKDLQQFLSIDDISQSKNMGFIFEKIDDNTFKLDVKNLNEPPEDPTKEISEPYTESDFLYEVFITPEKYQALKNLLLRKQNIILSGPPGVGKTFSAKRLAYSIIGCKDKKFIRTIQFHQNYSYEDFIQGFRPTDSGFKLVNGPFYDFCKIAESDSENKYFFIIDEINRGNLSKIFGELLMLIESDKRGEKIKILYSDELFSVPKNLYIIGMMNTADRSLAMIDYALRRRFSFFELEPAFDSEGFEKQRQNFDNQNYDKLIEAVKFVNSEIVKDSSLGDGCVIGHSYLCPKCEITDEWIESVIEYELIPLIREYWFDNKTDFDVCSKKLRSVLSDK